MIHLGDCIEVMRGMESESVDAVVTDPPYAMVGAQKPNVWAKSPEGDPYRRTNRGGFMGKQWDAPGDGTPAGFQAWCTEWGREALRVTKPGGYLLAFGGTRTHHRLICGLEDAGWEIRDELDWIFASGFPKSLDVSKALDKLAGAEREKVMVPTRQGNKPSEGVTWGHGGFHDEGAPATDLARKWEGWGTALKPAHEPIVMARKPLIGTVAQNVTRYGTGALNIDGSRIATNDVMSIGAGKLGYGSGLTGENPGEQHPAGRWPSNLLLSDPELFDEPNPYVVGSGATAGDQGGGFYVQPPGQKSYEGSAYVGASKGEHLNAAGREPYHYGDSGGYSRFFRIPSYETGERGLETGDASREDSPAPPTYPSHFIIPKADRADREPVLRGQLPEKEWQGQMAANDPDYIRADGIKRSQNLPRENAHPTVKPVDLMRHLVRLVTPPGGTVLDPFLGSGSTAIAAELEGFPWIGIEKEPEYVRIAEARLNGTQRGLGLDTELKAKPRETIGSFYSGPRRTPTKKWTGVYNDSGGIATGRPGYEDTARQPRSPKPKADSTPIWGDEEPAA